jgi:hypothetical protein
MSITINSLTNEELHVIMLLLIPKRISKMIYGKYPVYDNAADAQRIIQGQTMTRKQIIKGIRDNLTDSGYMNGRAGGE